MAKNVVPRSYGRPVLDALFPLVCPGCGRRGDPVCAGVCRAAPPGPARARPRRRRRVVGGVRVRGRGPGGGRPGEVPRCPGGRAVARRRDGRGARAAGAVAGLDVVTWAPTSRERRRRRGFDPAELLARAVARRLRLRCAGLLERAPGPPQTGLRGAERRRGPGHSRPSCGPARRCCSSTTSPPPARRSRPRRAALAPRWCAQSWSLPPPPGHHRRGTNADSVVDCGAQPRTQQEQSAEEVRWTSWSAARTGRCRPDSTRRRARRWPASRSSPTTPGASRSTSPSSSTAGWPSRSCARSPST